MSSKDSNFRKKGRRKLRPLGFKMDGRKGRITRRVTRELNLEYSTVPSDIILVVVCNDEGRRRMQDAMKGRYQGSGIADSPPGF